jgi:hypothetical protein
MGTRPPIPTKATTHAAVHVLQYIADAETPPSALLLCAAQSDNPAMVAIVTNLLLDALRVALFTVARLDETEERPPTLSVRRRGKGIKRQAGDEITILASVARCPNHQGLLS